MTGLLTLLALGAALYWGVVVTHIARTLRRPPRRTYASAVARGLPGDPSELARPLEARHWSFAWGRRGLRLPVWDVPVDDRGPVVILTHGWASSRIGALRRMEPLVDAGAGRLVAWDLPGHGEAPGASTLGIREPEALAALVDELRAQGEQRAIVLYGWSMGAGVSIAAAARGVDAALVIAEAPYRLAVTPAAAVLRERGVPPLGRLRPALALVALVAGADPLWRGFDRVLLALRTGCPVLVIHGSRDAICPLADGREIARAAPRGRLVIVQGAGHRDLWSEPQAEVAGGAVREALEGLVADGAPAPGVAGAAQGESHD
jgi:pimeloyl-ACP methyl ester carboxylesterase